MTHTTPHTALFAFAPRRLWAAGLLTLCAVVAGCGGESTLETGYGRFSGREKTSVNGTAVLAGMFEEAGHRASGWSRLSPRLGRCDVIVWAPDSREAPSPEVCDWLEDWLRDEPNRTLVYIGRDYDAEIEYWRTIRQGAPPAMALEIQSKLAQALAEQDRIRATQNTGSSCRWFQIKPALFETPLDRLRGPWARELNLDPAKADLRIASRLDSNNLSQANVSTWQGELVREPLLYQSRTRPMVTKLTRSRWRGSQVIVVDNGCFLLNLPLVNPERRRIAARLIEECGPAGQEVVFLQTGPGNPAIGQDADDRRPTGLEAFLVWPINVLMMHLAVLGILFSVAMFPIFGRPHEPEEETISDFGKHIHALGDLLQRSGDEAYASQQLRHYHDTVRRESGMSHRT